ncbi:MAG: AMP-binding protein [Clostridia bacterium]|nr:AMP-binding protein [Clostridia bacterium]
MRMVNNLHAKPPKVITDLRDLVKSGAEAFGDNTLYYYLEKGERKEASHNDIWRDFNRLGQALVKLGLAGKHVALMGEVHPAYTTTYLSVICTNGVIVPLDKDIAPDEINNFFVFTEAEALFYTAGMNKHIAEIAKNAPGIRLFVAIQPDETPFPDDRFMRYDDVLAMGDAEFADGHDDFKSISLDMEKMCAIICTSGTTGTSKGVMLSQKNLTAAVNSSSQSMAYDDKNTFISVLPAHHTYEMTCGNLALMNVGASVLVNDSLRHVMKNIGDFKPNALMMVPLFLETMHKKVWSEIRKQGKEKMVRAAMKANAGLLDVGIDMREKLFGKITAAFGGNLKSVVCGGAPISPEIIKDFYHFGITVLEGYGITECSPLVAVNRPGKVKFHSVGTPVLGCEVKIDYTPGLDTGEILVKGDNVMLGYYKNPEATAEVFTEDGWFRTGDIGYMDKKGYIFITGRKKNVIILSNGKNVFPEELEEHLSHNPDILESVVLGRRKEGGEDNELIITAIVVPNRDSENLKGKSDEEIEELLREAVTAVNKKLPSFKHMTATEVRFTEFEKTTSRKIKRYKVQ